MALILACFAFQSIFVPTKVSTELLPSGSSDGSCWLPRHRLGGPPPGWQLHLVTWWIENTWRSERLHFPLVLFFFFFFSFGILSPRTAVCPSWGGRRLREEEQGRLSLWERSLLSGGETPALSRWRGKGWKFVTNVIRHIFVPMMLSYFIECQLIN